VLKSRKTTLLILLNNMKSPEKQPTSGPGENGLGKELDIAAAKKYLEDVYGGEKSSIVVDKSVPISTNQETKKEESKEGETEKPIEIPKPESKKERVQETKADDQEKPKIFVPESIGQIRAPEEIEKYKKIKEEGEKAIHRKKMAEERESVAEQKREKGEIPSALDLAYERSKKIRQGIIEEKGEEKPIIVDVKELSEKLKREKEEQEKQVKVAKVEFIDLAKSIKEADEKEETKTETSLYNRAKEVFEAITGENLEKTVREKAKIEAQKEGFKVSTPKEYRGEKIPEAQDLVRQKERSAAIKGRWDMLSDKEKTKYFGKTEDKNNLIAINSARIRFATELKAKIEAKKQELAKGEKGINISEDTFYELMRRGLKAEDIKKRGFLGRIFLGGEIKILPLDKADDRGPLIKEKEYLSKLENKIQENIKEAAQEEVERKIIEGQRRWRAKKQRHAREIIQETAKKYEEEKKIELQTKEKFFHKITEKPKSFEKIGDIEKVIKKVDSDIKIKKEQQKKIQELKKKIKQKKELTLREKAFLNKVDSIYRKEAEK